MKSPGQPKRRSPERRTFDRLRGPLRLVALEDQWGLRPDISGSAWRIEPMEEGRPTSEVFLARIRRLLEADPERVRAEVSSLGVLGPPGWAIAKSAEGQLDWFGLMTTVPRGLDQTRVDELLARLRRTLDAPPSPEPTSTLVDPEVLAWARFNRQQAEGKLELMRDGGASRDIADAVEHYLQLERGTPDHASVREIARRVTARFAPRQGCSRLYTLIREDLRRNRKPARDSVWPRIAAIVLVGHSVDAAATAWNGLAMLAPLLLTIAGEPMPSPASEMPERDGACDVEGRTCRWPKVDLHHQVRDERTYSWRHLADELDVWRDALDAVETKATKGADRDARLRASLDQLARMLMTSLGEVRPLFARIDPADREALWSTLRGLCDDWLHHQGLAPDSLPVAGSLLGARAHALRALHRTFHGIGRCKDWGARTVGRVERCKACTTKYDAQRKRESRRRRGLRV